MYLRSASRIVYVKVERMYVDVDVNIDVRKIGEVPITTVYHMFGRTAGFVRDAIHLQKIHL
jgi:hypothetical protein